MDFFDWLEQRARQLNSLLCVGLDPRGDDAASVRDECYRLIDATADFACAFKPNSAFFERLGAPGVAALREVIARVPADVPVILDAKRADIADTAAAYAVSAFDTLGAHAITVNPYLGGDALTPFLARPDRGVFVLCKTSNPGADEFQALNVGNETIFEIVARRAAQWSGARNVGLVVGATDTAALARARRAAPHLWFLVPGIGAQGGDLEAALTAGLRPDGLGLLINASRSIARAAEPALEAKQLRDRIAEQAARSLTVSRERAERQVERPLSLLAQDLITSQCVRFGQFRLKSGIVSPIYLDLRRLVAQPVILARVARAYAGLLQQLQFDRLAGIPYAALPIATAIALEMNRPLIYPRREAKDYGTQAVIEGDFVAGETIVVLDDLATTGGSKIEAIQKIEAAGLKVRDIVVLIDREQGAGAMLAEAGYRLHAVATLSDLMAAWLGSAAITPAQYAEVQAFLAQHR